MPDQAPIRDLDEATKQAIIDDEHLKLLRLGYFVSALMTFFFSLMGLMYAGMGALMFSLPVKAEEGPPDAFVWAFVGLGVTITVFMIAFGVAKLYVAKGLRERKYRTLCFVVATLCLFGVPYGTLLGVLTWMVLSRPSVAEAFGVATSRP